MRSLAALSDGDEAARKHLPSVGKHVATMAGFFAGGTQPGASGSFEVFSFSLISVLELQPTGRLEESPAANRGLL